ncbi:MAG: hypothetical protein ACXWIU_08960 [Limisphaerales bacterium]
MSLFTKFQSLFNGGIDTAVEQERQTQLDAAITASNQNLVDKGIWTPEQQAAAQQNLTASDTPDIQGAIDAAYVQGAKEGLQNDINLAKKAGSAISDAANKTLWTVLKDVFGAIPWPIWIIGAVVLFVYLGGLGIVRRQIKNAS